MKINRVSLAEFAPDWVFEGSNTPEFSDSEYITSDTYNVIKSMPDSLDADALVIERDRIEACAKKGSLYHCSKSWDAQSRSALKEYAIVCGMDLTKFHTVSPEEVVEKYASSESRFDKQMDRGLGISKEEASMIEDPFKLDTAGDNDYMKEASWEDVKKPLTLNNRPSMMSNAIKPVRGGEDYFENSDIPVARGRNSINNPGAIEALAENEQEDTGARLKRENEERASQREANHESWEQGKVDAMEFNDIIPKGKVFPTEVMNAQPGIRGEVFDFDSIPEQSEGEKLAKANDDRRKLIQGEDAEAHEFMPRKAPVLSISDTFGAELAKHLGNEDS